jgi:hypothetical protein
VGQWNASDRFFGMNREEIVSKRVGTRYVETALTISPEGKAEGRIGGATLSGCVVLENRGWLGRLLHIKTDYIIRGRLVGPVAPNSEGGVHSISAPFDVDGGHMDGAVFVLGGGSLSPYPFLALRLDRQQ